MIEERNNLPQLPKGWVWTTLGTIADTVPGYGFPEKYQGDKTEEIPFFKVGDISKAFLSQNIYLVAANNYVSARVAQEMRAKPLKAGTVVFAKIGEAIKLNRRAILGQDSLVDNNVIGVYPFPETSSQMYVFYFLLIIRLGNLSRATTVPSVRKSDIEQISIPLPPLPEQHRIVARIEELITRLDAGVEALKKIQLQLKRYRQSVLKSAFSGELTAEWRKAHKSELEPASVLLEKIKQERKKNVKYKELPPLDTADLLELPEGWVWTRVEEIGQTETGTTPAKSKPEYYGKEYAFYKPTDLNAGYFVKESQDGLSVQGIKKARLLPTNSILVTCIGATIGKTGFIRREGASNQQINAVITDEGILPEYIYFTCITPYFQKSIIDKASSTTLPILNKGKFEVLPLPIPPFEEQQKIVEEIERHFSVTDEIEKTIDQSLTQADRLRQSILKKAFEGKLVPQHPDDEPAEKLLERIKAEKAKTRRAGINVH